MLTSLRPCLAFVNQTGYLARVAKNQDFPTAVIARRLRSVRDARGLTAEGLAEEMRKVGVPFDKTVVANLENGRRRFVTVQELLALAFVLNVSPIHLLVPPDDEPPVYLVTPTVHTSPRVTREWLKGRRPLYEQDLNRFITEIPQADAEEFWARFPTLREQLQAGPDGER